jgi:hypothetical protein
MDLVLSEHVDQMRNERHVAPPDSEWCRYNAALASRLVFHSGNPQSEMELCSFVIASGNHYRMFVFRAERVGVTFTSSFGRNWRLRQPGSNRQFLPGFLTYTRL